MKRDLNFLATSLREMAHSRVRNYATVGLTSSLVGGKDHGTVRLFEATRQTREWVTPHSHRFDFCAMVLAGSVENILFEEGGMGGEEYGVGVIAPIEGGLGSYKITRTNDVKFYETRTFTYRAGDVYAMAANQFHSIRFSKDAVVLFLEGPNLRDTSAFLEPYENGEVIETFKTEDWMFDHE